jgi:hypothetical protein
MSVPADTWESRFTPGPGGVLTDEVGVISGELTLRTEATPDGSVVLRIQYTGAEEWYTVAGGHFRLANPAAAGQFHQAAVALLAQGGKDAATLDEEHPGTPPEPQAEQA